MACFWHNKRNALDGNSVRPTSTHKIVRRCNCGIFFRGWHGFVDTRHSSCRDTLRSSLMAPYDFNAPDADVILRSSDGKEHRVHRLILSLSSPVFQGMFGLPRPSAEIPSIEIPDPSDALEPFIQYLYPLSPPKITDLST